MGDLGPFPLTDCDCDREIFLGYFMSLDVNSSIEIISTQLFATSLLQSQSLSGNGPLGAAFIELLAENIFCPFWYRESRCS